MDLAATQIYEDEDFLPTQRFSNVLESEGLEQVGTLSINSTEYQIKKGITKIGRHSNCDIVINDGTVSKIHAEIEASASEGSTWICDLNSSNRTKLNNLILRPSRSYELKNGSILEFGRVRAIYRIYCPTDDIVVPETPAPPRQKVTATIIPTTPDSSLNNSSRVDDDASVILGTQRDETNSIFRRPSLLQRQATINKRNSPRVSSVNTSDDLQISAIHTVCTIDITENEKINIFDAEMQEFENRCKIVPSIHDMETQEFPEGMHVEANADVTKPSVNVCDQITTNMRDIQNMETQNDIDINDEDGNEMQKSKIVWIQNQENLDVIQQNIHDLETQKFENERVINDICDAETQLKLDCNTNATKDTETQLKSNSIIDDQVDEHNNKNNTANAGSSETNTEEEIKNRPKSRSSSPGSLNLSSSGIDDEGPPSLNDSTHLLETTDLLEYFAEGIDKHEEIRASNASTPKLCKEALSKRDNNVETISNALDKEDDEDDEDIFDAPTQCINNETLLSDEINTKDAFIMCKISKKMREKSRPKQDNPDDSETDAEEYLEELAKEQHESVSVPHKLCNKNISNNNDPGTSVESEDMFDVPTQRSNLIDDVQDTSNPSANHPAKVNESNAIGNDTASTQIIKQIKDKPDQDECFSPDINDMPTQLLSHKTLPKTAITSRSLSLNDDVDETNMQIVNTDDNIIKSPNLRALEDNYENAEYELAPTQIISEVENEKKRHFEKSNLDDTLERNLNKMFENVSNDSIREPQQISTQCLEDILESSQCNNSLSTNEVSNVISLINNTSQIQSTRRSRTSKKRSLYDQSVAKTNASNVHNAESVSQDSDIYFSTPTRRKRNILKDTQELKESVNEIISSRQDTNSSKASKTNMEKIDDDNIITKSNRRGKRIRKNKTVLMKNDDVNKIVSNEDNERKLRKSKMKRATTATSETDKQILEEDFDEAKVNDSMKDSTSNPNIYISCSLGEQSAQTSDTLYESDDNILTRLPPVRISGTLSNPVSPSGSSISISSHRFKQNATTNKKNKRNLKNKSLNKQDTKRDKNLNQTSDDKVSLLDNIEPTNVMNTSEDSDSETNFKRFKQMANRMYNKLHYVKRHGKRTTQNTKSAVSDKKKNTHSSHNVSKDSEQNADIESRNSLRIGTRTTRHSSRRNDETHSHMLQNKLGTESMTDKPLKSETKSNITNSGKRFLTEEDIEQTNSKKRKTDKVSNIENHLVSMSDRRNTRKRTRTINDGQLQSPNMSEHSIETNSHGNLSVSEKFSADDKTAFKTTLEKTQKTLHLKIHENVSFTKSRGTRHKANVAIMDESNDKTKQAPTKIEKVTSHMFNQGKTLKIILSPIIGNESQEVEMIMGGSLSNVQNENLSIKERSNVNILRRQSRIKSRKRTNANAEENSVIIESSVSSVVDTAESDNPALKAKRGRFAKKNKKDSAPLVSEAKVPEKKDIFKKPVADSYLGNLSTSENSQDSMESNVSSNSRSSRSKTANKKKEKLGIHQDPIDNISSRVNISIDNMSLVSTPSRTRRSTSSLNSTSIIVRHKILFTGITEDYSKTIKMLGGNKVEEPAKCTILVTDKVRRTYKFLCALAKGIPIVSIDWLKDSESVVQFLDWQNYVLKDPVAEAKFGFRLRKSLDKAKEKRLLNGYTVILTSGVAPPPIEELKDMIVACGGKALIRPPVKWPERAMIISREEDLTIARKFLTKAPKTVTVQSTEFILTGILRQEIDFDKYKLM